MSKKQQSNKINCIRGMHDILPAQTPLWQFFESRVRTLLQNYAYSEIRMPLVESTDLFCRSIGEVTDIVEKEMYTFEDRNGDSLTLRPEGTASCVRAGIQHGLFHNQQQRLWYMGPMFRHERPQKGRYRQFHQMGVETYGMSGPDIDAELILLTARLWKQLGLENIRLEINTLGSAESRRTYRDVLLAYLNKHIDILDEDSLRRLESNPLRILDSKNPAMQSMIDAAPSLLDHLDEESSLHFSQLTAILDNAGIKYVINTRLVRGLDYYCIRGLCALVGAMMVWSSNLVAGQRLRLDLQWVLSDYCYYLKMLASRWIMRQIFLSSYKEIRHSLKACLLLRLCAMNYLISVCKLTAGVVPLRAR